MIILSCDIKISAVCSFVSSQSTPVTDRQTNGQNYDFQYRASVAASSGKNDELAYRKLKAARRRYS